MKCKKIKSLLADYVDGMLNQSERRLVEEHVNKCSQCSRELVMLKILSGISIKVNYPPPLVWNNFAQILHRRIKLETSSALVQKDGYFRRFIEIPIIAAIVCLALVPSWVMLNSIISRNSSSHKYEMAQPTYRSESLIVADIISRTMIDEKDVKEIKRSSKFVRSIEQRRQYEDSQDLLMDTLDTEASDTLGCEQDQNVLIRSLLENKAIPDYDYLAYDGGNI